MPYHEAQARGWISQPKVQQQQFALRDKDKIKQLLNLLAGTALSQSKTQVAMLNIRAQLQDKARFQLVLSDDQWATGRESLFILALNSRLQFEAGSEVRLTIGETDPNCKFLGFLKQLEG